MNITSTAKFAIGSNLKSTAKFAIGFKSGKGNRETSANKARRGNHHDLTTEFTAGLPIYAKRVNIIRKSGQLMLTFRWSIGAQEG